MVLVSLEWVGRYKTLPILKDDILPASGKCKNRPKGIPILHVKLFQKFPAIRLLIEQALLDNLLDIRRAQRYSLCESGMDFTEVVAIPRLMPNPSEPHPAKLIYVTGGVNSKLRYVKTVLLTVKQNRQFDLIICAHINLIPLAMMLRVWLKTPVLLEIYGIDAWQATKSRLTNILVRKVDAFVSISEITRQRFISWSKLSAEKNLR